MPSIRDSVATNTTRRANQPSDIETSIAPSPLTERPAPSSNAPPDQPVSGLPIRGIFTPNFILATDFNDAGSNFRKGVGLRSPVFAYPTPKPSTFKLFAPSQGLVPVVQPSSITAASKTAALGAPVQDSIATNGRIDSTQTYFTAKGGAIPPTIVGTSAAIFTYTSATSSATSSATITWGAIDLFYSDGTEQIVPSGSVNITALTPTTTYYYYPYVGNDGTVHFVEISGASGTPPILYTPQSPTAAQQMNSQQVTALASAGVPLITPTSGSGGGSGGGSSLCVRSTMIVLEKLRGEIPLSECQPGFKLLSREGWTEIQNIKFIPQKQFIRFETDYGAVEISPTHHITNAEDQSVPAMRVSLADFLIRRDGFAAIRAIKLVEVADGVKAWLHCEPIHTFFAGCEHAELLASNTNPNS